jgi:hypothetical protein
VSRPQAPADADSHVTRFPKTYVEAACELEDKAAALLYPELTGVAQPDLIGIMPERNVCRQRTPVGHIGKHGRRLGRADAPFLGDRPAHSPGLGP